MRNVLWQSTHTSYSRKLNYCFLLLLLSVVYLSLASVCVCVCAYLTLIFSWPWLPCLILIAFVLQCSLSRATLLKAKAGVGGENSLEKLGLFQSASLMKFVTVCTPKRGAQPGIKFVPLLMLF